MNDPQPPDRAHRPLLAALGLTLLLIAVCVGCLAAPFVPAVGP